LIDNDIRNSAGCRQQETGALTPPALVIAKIRVTLKVQFEIPSDACRMDTNKYGIFFSDAQTAYTPKKALKASCWGNVIRCVDKAIESMQVG
jgi:hypothetical protein